MRGWLAFVCLLGAPFAYGACGGDAFTSADTSSDGGIDDGLDADQTADGDNGDVPIVPGDSGHADAAPPMDAPAEVGTIDGCAAVAPDSSAGVFVAPGGASMSCGSAAAPCGSIQTAIGLAAQLGKKIVYVGEGTYTEDVTLKSGVTVQGGWVSLGGGQWVRDCAATVAGATTIRAASSNKTVVADGVTGAAIESLSIASKDPASVGAGESLFGVFAINGAQLRLANVNVVTGTAGTGVTGSQGSPGTAGADGCTNAGNGNPGTKGSGGSSGAPGSFSSNGYTPTTAGQGGTGTVGNNGTAGGPPQCINTIAGCTPDLPPLCDNTATGQVCGGPATVGCAGNPGGGGFGAGGGGSSVAVLAWGATVVIDRGALTAGAGGTGGVGGAGGPGGPGGHGAQGPGKSGITSCVLSSNLCSNKSSIAAGGSAGGQGGSGGQGGQGGGGGGGSSYCYVTGSGGSVSTSGTQLQFGSPGQGGAGGTVGQPGQAATHN